MGTLRDSKIASIPENETVLLEGMLQTMNLYSGNRSRYTFKFFITDKGLWTRSKNFLCIKARENFVPFSNLAGYRKNRYLRMDCFIFYPANGKKPGSRIFFEDTAAAEAVLQKYLKQLNVRKGDSDDD